MLRLSESDTKLELVPEDTRADDKSSSTVEIQSYDPHHDAVMKGYNLFWDVSLEKYVHDYITQGTEGGFFNIMTRLDHASKNELEYYQNYFKDLESRYQKDPLNALTDNELILLGDAYYSGKVIKLSDEAAAACFNAAKKNPFAIYKLGLLSYFGENGKTDYARAKELFEVAKAQGVHAAGYRLGKMYHEGLGSTKILLKRSLNIYLQQKVTSLQYLKI